MSHEVKLGTTPVGTEGRDAVHIAIVPVRAAVTLWSCNYVKLNANNEAVLGSFDDCVGMVDPFRPKDQQIIDKGSWFWLCLLPKTITGLRHVWEHPAFPLSTGTPAQETPPVGKKEDKESSVAWLMNYVREHCPYWEDESDYGYWQFLKYVKNHRWIYYYGTDCHGLSDVIDADELFHHLSVILGQRIDASYFDGFTCVC